MMRTTLKFFVVCALLLGGTAGLMYVQRHDVAAEKLRAAEHRNDLLRRVVQNLTAETRVADVIVTEQHLTEGRLFTTLLFVEYAKDGQPLPGKRFTIAGNVAHIDAMVVKFDGKFVEQNDPLRGHSVALFTRLYGETQAPAQGFPIDSPNAVPDVYRGADPATVAFERELWSNFWKLADDANYRNELGVRVAQGEGVWCPFQKDRLYTLTIESDGGLNITSEPLKGIYREAMRRGEPSSTASLPASR